MKIGKSTVPRTAICASDEDTIVVRGHDLCRDLVGKVSFTEHFYLLLTGRRPTPTALAMLDATLVAIAEHGLVPSVQASRMTFAAAPDALQGAVAAGILGCGSVILGASETAGRLFHDVETRMDEGEPLDAAARAVVQAWRGRSARSPATAIRCTSAATRASIGCSRSRASIASMTSTSRSRRRSSARFPRSSARN
jgi:citrate synthase